LLLAAATQSHVRPVLLDDAACIAHAYAPLRDNRQPAARRRNGIQEGHPKAQKIHFAIPWFESRSNAREGLVNDKSCHCCFPSSSSCITILLQECFMAIG
jgi:hypothetical protein